MRYKYLLMALFMITSSVSKAQKIIPLYEGNIPNAKSAAGYNEVTRTDGGRQFIDKVSVPTLTVYLPEKAKANGTSVIILPGGGYQTLAVSHEGAEIAQEFNKYGITAFVLKYRLPSDLIMVDKTIGPLQDAQRAIQMVRQNAAKWALKTDMVGILGSSAGGHLASAAATHFDKGLIDNTTNINLRPDFVVLLYPVISFGQFTHSGSYKNLMGANPTPEAVRFYSNELQVTGNTPPVFLLHATDDKVVPVKNSLLFYEALVNNNVPAELHVYEQGGHGFGLHNTTNNDAWFGRLISWMQVRGLIANKASDDKY
jgi:acetyl esterase/lipase